MNFSHWATMTDRLSLSHSVIVCTNRDKETLYRSIDRVFECQGSKYLNVIVVLNGNDERSLTSTGEILANRYGQSIQILYSEPGLVNARNVALQNVNTDVITFIDDDFLIPRNYFGSAERMLISDSELNGLAPRISGLYVNYLDLRSFLRKHKYGSLTSSGQNFWIPDASSYEIEKVEWLPGCCMTYRVSAIRGMCFNRNLQNGPTRGYSLGEDVDFSMRVGKVAAILSVTGVHLQEPSVRDSTLLMAKAKGAWLMYLTRNNEKVKSSHVVGWLVVRLAYFFTRSIFQPQKYKILLRGNINALLAYITELINPKLTPR
jgi:glycosyltransferase involved in cell wall biosynthesis